MATHVLLADASGYTTADGVAHSAGTAIARVLWDGSTPWQPPAGLTAATDTGQAVYVLVSPTPTTLDAYNFIGRLTNPEQAAVMAAKPMWGVQLAASGTVDVTNATLLADFAAAVSAGLLTQDRATQILDLSKASP